ncbi:hypothetical protein [Kribbella sp. CA-293567]|uniref:hypothetical protein n=1 Tax=Kribbella sp. CA-293567 TaxID=3002436 RepID=UPI0022DDA5FD|nr:hypothetical protein [Kribbella sp. CA-293567]WBQ02430.1 hypothetical protein OX958_20840 [Kribbella sp. CA-293567]
MPDPRTDLLIEYVEERTPSEPPPFEFVERAVRRQRRTRKLLAAAAVVVVAGGVAFAAADVQRAEEGPAAPPPSASTPEPAVLDDGPPPQQFKYGSTTLILDREIPVTAAYRDPESTSGLIVEAARGNSGTCLPHTVVRILAQDEEQVRIAAYRYAVAPETPEGAQCVKPQGEALKIPLDLRWELGGRKVVAGSLGDRAVLK